MRTDAELLAHQDPDMTQRHLVPKANAWYAEQRSRRNAPPIGSARDRHHGNRRATA